MESIQFLKSREDQETPTYMVIRLFLYVQNLCNKWWRWLGWWWRWWTLSLSDV